MSATFDFTKPAGRDAWTRELLAPIDEAKWNELAWELFAYQYARVPAYKRFCLGRGMPPQEMRSWKDIPAMPQQVFKLEKLYARGLRKAEAIYETSGTTTGQPGRQFLASTDIYRAVALANAARADGQRLRVPAFSRPLAAGRAAFLAERDVWFLGGGIRLFAHRLLGE